MQQEEKSDLFTIVLPNSGKAYKELQILQGRRPNQLGKAINKLKLNPTNFKIKGIEKLKNSKLGTYSIRISSGDRVFYDVDLKKKKVFILRAGKHDYYKMLQ